MMTPMAPLNARQIVAWMDRHGGLQTVRTRPYPGGWANTLVCVDGEKITTSLAQDAEINPVLHDPGRAQAVASCRAVAGEDVAEFLSQG